MIKMIALVTSFVLVSCAHDISISLLNKSGMSKKVTFYFLHKNSSHLMVDLNRNNKKYFISYQNDSSVLWLYPNDHFQVSWYTHDSSVSKNLRMMKYDDKIIVLNEEARSEMKMRKKYFGMTWNYEYSIK
jgi:hypothetical protein